MMISGRRASMKIHQVPVIDGAAKSQWSPTEPLRPRAWSIGRSNKISRREMTQDLFDQFNMPQLVELR
jgi:hypothetical protein